MALTRLAYNKDIHEGSPTDSLLRFVILFIRLSLLLLLIFLIYPAYSQSTKTDSLQQLINQHPTRDTAWVRLRCELMKANTSKGYYLKNEPLARECLRVADSLGDERGMVLALLELTTARYYLGLPDDVTLKYNRQARELAEKNHFTVELIQLTIYEATYNLRLGETRKCLDAIFKAREMALKTKDQHGLGLSSHLLGNFYYNVFSDYNNALKYYLESVSYSPEKVRFATLANIGRVFEILKEYDKAASYNNQALRGALKAGEKWPELLALRDKGHLFFTLKKYDSAKQIYSRNLGMSKILGIPFLQAQCLHGISGIYKEERQYDSAMIYLGQAEKIILEIGSTRELIGYYADMAEIRHRQGRQEEERQYLLKAFRIEPQRDKKNYLKVLSSLVAMSEKKNNLKEALNYQRQISVLQDSSFNEQKVREAMHMEANFHQELSRKEIEVLETENQLKETLLRQSTLSRNIMIALSIVLTLAIVAVYYAYRVSRNSKMKLEEKNLIIENQKEELTSSLDDLQRMKNQLVLSEKMASLGQLAAGVAHEVNNPLNFIMGGVEGLSTVHKEMTTRLKNAGPALYDEVKDLDADGKSLLSSIQNGIDRITKIVRSLKAFSSPQQQRSSVPVQELIDTTYTLMSAKLSEYRIRYTLKDNTRGEVVFVNATEISQVLVNLIDNSISALEGRPDPQITVETVNLSDSVEIRVIDNGSGIPEKIRMQVMEPFFTTKATGKGTGLGLYVSYGLVEKHKGSLTFESSPQGTVFTLLLKKRVEDL